MNINMAVLTNTSRAIMIVPQLLKTGNYKSWSIFMEDYLISQELWDGIIVPFSADHPLLSESERRKRNAAALNAIKISCGPESFVRIKYTRSAKDALDMLAEMHKTEPEIDESTPKQSTLKMNVAMASMIVPELLERGNYERWSIFMKNYLVSQDLWVVTQCWSRPPKVSSREWRKKNAATLHAIQISCGLEKFNQIKEICLAKEAWFKLKKINVEEVQSEMGNSEYHEEEEKEEEEEEEEEETRKIASVPVPELLASDNYKKWSICMKSYLVSQDLWDAVLYDWVPAGVDTKEWIKKNAAALHVIQISCRPKNFDEIKEITSAKIAWNTLQQKHKEKHAKDGPPSDILDYWELTGFQTMKRTQSLIIQNAIHNGDVDAVMDFFKGNPEAKGLGYWTGSTNLHYATSVGKLNIVKALVESTPVVQEIKQKNAGDNTALRYAARYGNTEVAKYLVSKDPTLLSMEDKNQEIPVVTACRSGRKKVTNFLYSETPFEILLPENGEQGSKLLLGCFKSKRFDIMFDILHRCPSLIDKNWKDLLEGFAEIPAAFISGSGLTFWQWWIYECLKVHMPNNFAVVTINKEGKTFEGIPMTGRLWRLASILLPFLGMKQIHALKLSHVFAHEILHLICLHLSKFQIRKYEDLKTLRKALTKAIENGIYDFLIQMVETNEDLLLTPRALDDETLSGNYLMDAITFRQEKFARFIIGLPLGKVFINRVDSQKNNLLHIAGKLASDSQLSRISGAALQMQKEMQWFKEVESLVRQHKKNVKNKNGETPYQVLAREHKDLLKKAEDWMKELASSYIIVGTLIITIMFAAAFTIPGGNKQDDGFPIFKNKVAFMVYTTSDAISLFAAAASVLIFLGFLTSRYNMEDFHKSIPKKLIAGLSTLFISLAGMMIAFCSAIFLMLENRWWIIIPFMLLAGIPISLFVWLQFPLLLEIYILTYKSPIFSKQNKSILLSEKED